jgi:hypothetical protein
MQFGILPLHCSKVNAECVHSVWYPALQSIEQFLQSAYMQFGIMPLHCSKVTAECVHAVWYPAITLQ